MGKRARRRNKRRNAPISWGKIVYTRAKEAALYRLLLSSEVGMETTKRTFKSYEDALVHLTDITLGLTIEDEKYQGWIPTKVTGGIRQGGQTLILHKKLFNQGEVARVRDRVRQTQARLRQLYEQRRSEQSYAKDLAEYEALVRKYRACPRDWAPKTMAGAGPKAGQISSYAGIKVAISDSVPGARLCSI